MTTKTKKTKVPFSEFMGGGEGIDSLEELELTREGVRAVFPHLCVLEVSEKHYGDYRASIISEGSKIDTERMLREMFSFLIEERKSQGWLSSAILNLRYGEHNAQFLNGHLERSEDDEMMPMREVMDASDETILKRLVSLARTDLDDLSKLVDPHYRQTDIQIGLTDKIWSRINREKSKEKVAEILGFETVSKTSEGQISNGNGSEIQTCLATRLCVHSEELKKDDVIDSAVDTFRRMRKLRKDPSFAMGVENVIEICANSGEVSLKVYDNKKGKAIFSKFLGKLLEIVGAEDFRKAKVSVEQKVHVPDSSLEKIVDRVGNYLARNQSKVNLGLVAISLPLIAAYLLANVSYLEAMAVIIPVLCVLAISVWLSSEEGWMARLGQKSRVLTLWITVALLYLLLLSVGLGVFLKVIGCIVVIVTVITAGEIAAMKTEEKRRTFADELEEGRRVFTVRLSEFVNRTGIWLERTILKILANSLVKVILLLFVAMLGIIAAFSFSMLLIPLLIGYYLFFVLLNKRFWEEMERDREMVIDKFFVGFRENRPGLSSNCEVRFDTNKCGRLRNPLRGAFGKSIKFGQGKFPKWLTLPNVLRSCYRFMGGKWIKSK